MNFKALAYSFAVLLVFSLLSYAFSLLGVAGSAIDSPWKLLALSIGLSIVIGFAYPFVRGVRKGDRLFAFITRRRVEGGQAFVFNENVLVTALSNGRKGGKIRVDLGNGRLGKES